MTWASVPECTLRIVTGLHNPPTVLVGGRRRLGDGPEFEAIVIRGIAGVVVRPARGRIKVEAAEAGAVVARRNFDLDLP